MSIRFVTLAYAQLAHGKIGKNNPHLTIANGYLIVPYEQSPQQKKDGMLAIFDISHINDAAPYPTLKYTSQYEIPQGWSVSTPVLHSKKNILVLAPYNFAGAFTQQANTLQIKRPSSQLDPIDEYRLDPGESCYTPVVSWNHLFVTTNKGRGLLFSLDQQSLHLLKIFEFNNQKPLHHISLNNTVIIENSLFISCETGFYSINLAKSEQRQTYWDLSQHLVDDDTICTVPKADGSVLYFGTANGRLLKIDNEKKEALWSTEQSYMGERIENAPLITNKHLYITCKAGQKRYQIQKIDKSTGELVASYTTGDYGQFIAPIVEHGPYILAACGTDIGRILVLKKWNLRLVAEHGFEAKSAVYAPPLVWNNLICVASRKGEIQILRLDESYDADTKATLRKRMGKHLNKIELKELCEDLELKSRGFEDGYTESLIIEIVSECERQKQLTQLIAYLYEAHEVLRPYLENNI